MDKLTDVIPKDSGHQLLECRGCVTVTHLYYLAPECAKYCGECHLMDMFQYNAYLFIRFGHIKFSVICHPGHIIANDILVREWGHVLDCVIVLVS